MIRSISESELSASPVSHVQSFSPAGVILLVNLVCVVCVYVCVSVDRFWMALAMAMARSQCAAHEIVLMMMACVDEDVGV